MTSEITVITTPFMLNVSVNCYLVKTGDGYILIDTGMPRKRSAIEATIENAGCRPGNLKLIMLTHGDLDHCGNAAYFRKKFGTKVAMHEGDSGMVEYGDMFWNREKPNILVRKMLGIFMGLSKSRRFKPDLYLEAGDDLSAYGFDATVLHIPGHSQGSIGILTAGGDLFCGDLLANTDKPDIWSIMPDEAAAGASVEQLKDLAINTVYPGHGKPFSMQQFVGAA
jgi:glyoxylase-like metal-dependent hydrolase (beta-lactamase superfamily II)